MVQFRNNKTQEVVSSDLTKREIVECFLDTATDGQWLWFWLVKYVNDHKNGKQCREMIAFIGDSFLLAIGYGLKSPMIRLHYKTMRRYKIYLSQKGTICFKTGRLVPGTNDPIGDEEYLGCLWQGKFLPNRDRKPLPMDLEVLEGLNTDPAVFLAQCSKDMCRCCYCYKPLEDKRSKDVGYGKVCAQHWGLPWGDTYSEKIPSFADLWRGSDPDTKQGIRWLCSELRHNPYNPDTWEILKDALMDGGWSKERLEKLKMPNTDVRVPAL
jgi:hypothetical protein